MLHEYRVYEAMPGKMSHLVEIMGKCSKIFEKNGMHALGYWTPAVGETSDRFIYILAFEDMAHREKAWPSFFSDPDWKTLAPEFSENRATIARSFKSFLSPTTYSPAK